jgi:hypothetical protein
MEEGGGEEGIGGGGDGLLPIKKIHVQIRMYTQFIVPTLYAAFCKKNKERGKVNPPKTKP